MVVSWRSGSRGPSPSAVCGPVLWRSSVVPRGTALAARRTRPRCACGSGSSRTPGLASASGASGCCCAARAGRSTTSACGVAGTRRFIEGQHRYPWVRPSAGLGPTHRHGHSRGRGCLPCSLECRGSADVEVDRRTVSLRAIESPARAGSLPRGPASVSQSGTAGAATLQPSRPRPPACATAGAHARNCRAPRSSSPCRPRRRSCRCARGSAWRLRCS